MMALQFGGLVSNDPEETHHMYHYVKIAFIYAPTISISQSRD
jgi:hypothetical protein